MRRDVTAGSSSVDCSNRRDHGRNDERATRFHSVPTNRVVGTLADAKNAHAASMHCWRPASIAKTSIFCTATKTSSGSIPQAMSSRSSPAVSAVGGCVLQRITPTSCPTWKPTSSTTRSVSGRELPGRPGLISALTATVERLATARYPASVVRTCSTQVRLPHPVRHDMPWHRRLLPGPPPPWVVPAPALVRGKDATRTARYLLEPRTTRTPPEHGGHA